MKNIWYSTKENAKCREDFTELDKLPEKVDESELTHKDPIYIFARFGGEMHPVGNGPFLVEQLLRDGNYQRLLDPKFTMGVYSAYGYAERLAKELTNLLSKEKNQERIPKFN